MKETWVPMDRVHLDRETTNLLNYDSSPQIIFEEKNCIKKQQHVPLKKTSLLHVTSSVTKCPFIYLKANKHISKQNPNPKPKIQTQITRILP